MKTSFPMFRSLSAVALAAGLVACGGGGGGGAANTAPEAVSVPNVTVLSGSAFSHVLPAFTDADGNALTYALTREDDSALPAGLSLDSATRTVTGSTALALTGPLSLKIKATDAGGLSASAVFTLNAVSPGIYKYAAVPDLFHGVVLPGASGVADVWTWEFQQAAGQSAGYTKFLTGNVASLGASLTTTAAARRIYVPEFTEDEENWSQEAGKTVIVAPVVSGSAYTSAQSFTVGSSSYTASLNAEWATPAALNATDWLGTWILKERLPDTVTIVTTTWTVDAQGVINGTKKTGDSVLCTASGRVTVSTADKAVARITVSNLCAGDTDAYTGISFAQKRVSGSVTDRAVLMGLNGSSRFVAKSFCRAGVVDNTRTDNTGCTE